MTWITYHSFALRVFQTETEANSRPDETGRSQKLWRTIFSMFVSLLLSSRYLLFIFNGCDEFTNDEINTDFPSAYFVCVYALL